MASRQSLGCALVAALSFAPSTSAQSATDQPAADGSPATGFVLFEPLPDLGAGVPDPLSLVAKVGLRDPETVIGNSPNGRPWRQYAAPDLIRGNRPVPGALPSPEWVKELSISPAAPAVTNPVLRTMGWVLVGDYNEDGLVDTADHCMWRDRLEINFDLPDRVLARMQSASLSE